MDGLQLISPIVLCGFGVTRAVRAPFLAAAAAASVPAWPPPTTTTSKSTADASVAKSAARTAVGARDVDSDVDAAACLSERTNAPRMTRAFDRVARAPSFDEGSEQPARRRFTISKCFCIKKK